ncbi:MAG: ATP-binding protein [Cyanobacteria bacterium CRU_2_1]|nr:ATP-binding protein [Cyanobacteria bacterium CRU_2_1]
MALVCNQAQEEFSEVEDHWKLEELYTDMELAKRQLAPHKRKGLTAVEKRHLRGLLCGYSPAEIACKLSKNNRGIEADLCKSLYRYLELLTARKANTLKNWRDVIDWLEEAGYKISSNKVQNLAPLEYFASACPFIAGPSILHPRYFFGRERELKRLFSLFKHPPLQNAAVIGPLHSGKTSLLRYLQSITTISPSQLRCGQRTDWLPQPERYRWIFVDFQDPRMGTRQGLLEYLLTCLELPVSISCNLERFLEVVSRSLRTPTVILLDEIGVALQRYRELDNLFWEGLRSLANNQVEGNLAFVIAASDPLDQLREYGHLGSSFFNIFGYTAHLKPLLDSEAYELIASSPIPFSPTDVDWVLTQSQRWPLLLQILCRERFIALEAGETDDAWKKEGLEQIKRSVTKTLLKM